jgi:hypothetical protein
VLSIIDSPLPTTIVSIQSSRRVKKATYEGDLLHVVLLNGTSQILLNGFFQQRRAFIVGQLKNLFHSIANVFGVDLGVTKG